MDIKINIANDFSETPGARYFTDGPYSGEKFYKECLKLAFQKALESNSRLVVNLDGTEGYATSFLDEAFGSLSKDFGEKRVFAILDLISEEEPSLIGEINGYIREALAGRYSNAS